MTRKRWLLAAAITAVLALVIGVLIVRPLVTGPDPNRPTTAPTDPPPWEYTYIPGYDTQAGPLELPSATDAPGEQVTAHLALDDGATTTGGTVGLSFDATDLASPLWDSPESNLALTLQELDRPVLRFGGNGVDRRMWWTSSDEPAPDWAEVTVTPEDLEGVAAVAEEIDAQVTIALDLGNDDADRAADMAAHAQEAFGERLIAVAVGNEPNGYHHPNQPQLAVRDADWGPEAYQDSLIEYAEAIEEAAPGLPIAGPGAYDAPWWRAFAEADLPQAEALTMHWYPLWDCEDTQDSIATPTLEDLTSPAIRERAQDIIGMADEVAAEHDLPLWMEETGPTSCPGTNETSRTHAQALWTVDFTLTAMSSGVERMAFHSTLNACDGGAPMSPVCAQGSYSDPGTIIGGRTSFQALMLLGWLPDGQVLTPSVSGDGTVMVHGVIGEDGELALVVVDLRDPAGTEDAATVEVSAPSELPSEAPEAWQVSEGSILSAEELDAQQSRLTAPAQIAGEMAAAPLAPAQPLSVVSQPGSVTLLTLEPEEPAEEAEPSDDGGEEPGEG